KQREYSRNMPAPRMRTHAFGPWINLAHFITRSASRVKATRMMNRRQPRPSVRPTLQSFVQNGVFLLASGDGVIKLLMQLGVGRIEPQTLLEKGNGLIVLAPSQVEISQGEL